MKKITLTSGDAIPAVGLGTWQAQPNQLQSVIADAIDLGYRHIDCAAIYLNEPEIGAIFERLLKNRVVTRDELWVTSKLWNSFHAPEDIEKALKQTLHDLQLDYLDLYLMHWPLAFKRSLGLMNPECESDYLSMSEVPLGATWQAMHACQEKGLVKNIGVSNFSVSKLKQLIDSTNIVPAMNQVECHPFLPQKQLQSFCKAHGIVMTAYSPLGSAGRPDHFKALDEPILLQNKIVLELAHANNIAPAQLLLAWLLQRGFVVIPKSSNKDRLLQNLTAASIELDGASMSALDQVDLSYRYVSARFWEAPDRTFKAEQLWA